MHPTRGQQPLDNNRYYHHHHFYWAHSASDSNSAPTSTGTRTSRYLKMVIFSKIAVGLTACLAATVTA
ncbi:hypothetical protein PMIN02_003238 [Paraphaeosphaeria minitans]